MHNIAEGQDAGSDPDFARFLRIARRSASEVQSELYLALDRGYIAATDLQKTYALADDVKRLINGLIAYLQKSEVGGGKVREVGGSYLTEDWEPDDLEA
jgi:four helix bundle protein